MILVRFWKETVLFIAAGFWIFGVSPSTAGVIRVRGDIGVKTYSYQDADGNDHWWLQPQVQTSFYHSDLPYALHFSADYLGDNADDFSHSGRARLLNGYFQYGSRFSSSSAQVGRFFYHRGIALGVLDGLAVDQQFTPHWGLSAFAGGLAPLSSEFKTGDLNSDFAGGGEARFIGGDFWKFSRSRMALSYIYKLRDNQEITRRMGLTLSGKFMERLNLNGLVEWRPQGTPFRRALVRGRLNVQPFNFMVEGAYFSPNVEDYSWFKRFDLPTLYRLRFSAQRWLVGHAWGGSLELAGLFAENKTGLRISPQVITPYGQAGYKITTGDQGHSNGPWINLIYQPLKGVSAYARWSMVSYEWNAFDIESEELRMTQIGVKYRPAFRSDLTLSAEYQLYKSPQFDQDRRGLAGISWNFDTAKGRR
ncbi:MAG: hypothetical protein V2A61_02935 [Calditrichota bacterium]